MRTVFFDIDSQLDFLYPAGALYVPGAERIVPAISRLNRYAAQHLEQNEMALFPAGLHHVITASSDVNRLCVLMIPGFSGEVPSDKL